MAHPEAHLTRLALPDSGASEGSLAYYVSGQCAYLNYA